MSIVVVVTAFPVPEHRAEVRCELWVISGVLRPPFLRKRRAAGAICKDRILKIVPILANPRSALMQVIGPGQAAAAVVRCAQPAAGLFARHHRLPGRTLRHVAHAVSLASAATSPEQRKR